MLRSLLSFRKPIRACRPEEVLGVVARGQDCPNLEVVDLKKMNGKMADQNVELLGAKVELETTQECNDDYINHLLFLLRPHILLL